jgi:hypothetical protein
MSGRDRRRTSTRLLSIQNTAALLQHAVIDTRTVALIEGKGAKPRTVANKGYSRMEAQKV